MVRSPATCRPNGPARRRPESSRPATGSGGHSAGQGRYRRPQRRRRKARRRLSASGFLISADVTVKLNDKRELKAKALGLDKASGVALIIYARNLPVLKRGRTTTTRVGVDFIRPSGYKMRA